MDEKLFVSQGKYSIEYDAGEGAKTVIVRPGDVFIDRAGTTHTMTTGPEGVT